MNTKGVEDGIVCEFCGTHCYQGAEHNARVEDNARFDDPKPAAVPVEERTRVLMEALKAVENERLSEHYDRLREAEDIKFYRKDTGEDAAYSLAIRDAEEAIKALITAPIPEERTAEMEELMELLRKSAIAAGGAKWTHDHQMYVTDENGLMVADVRGFGRGMDENFAKHITAASPENILRLLDHIEGTAKCKKAIDKTFELACEKWPNITVCEDCFDEKRSDEILRNMWICAMHIED